MIFQKVGNNTSLQNMGSFVADIGTVELDETWNLGTASQL